MCRQKWVTRPDYRRRTIQRALSNLTETYTPDDGARMVVGKGGESSASPSPSSYIERDAGMEAKDQVPSVPASLSYKRDGDGDGTKPDHSSEDLKEVRELFDKDIVGESQ